MKRPAMPTKPTPQAQAAEVRGRANAERREFSPRQSHRPMMAELYRRAEAQMRKKPKFQKPEPNPPEPDAEPQRLLHELQVHQIELELQNEELRKTRDEMEAARDKYSDLYDFAPVGYLTLDREGTIAEVNLAGASLLGVARAALVKRRFGVFVSPADRSAFAAFLQQVFKGKAREECDLRLLLKGTHPVDVRMRAIVSSTGQACQVAVTDITERKQAEDKVRVSEVRYRRLFEAAHDGVLLLDPATRKITDANPFMTRLLGYPHAQLVGKELFEIGLLKDEAASQEMFRKLKVDREIRYEDLPLESQDGRHQEVEVVANLYQEDGRAVIQCNIRDITARKRTEIVANRLAALVESSDDSIVGIDTDAIVTSWNRGAELVFGYTAREMLGASFMRLIPANRQDEEKKILEKLRRGESVQHLETLRRTKDGRLIHVSVTASPIKGLNGKVIGASKVARDISQRKQVEEILRRNQALFSALIEQAPFGVYVVDAKFRMQQVNRKARPAFRKVQHLLGRGFSEVVHLLWPKKVADQIEKRFRHTLKTGEPYQSPEFTARRQDIGKKEVYEWQIQRVTLPAGEHGVVCFFNNITARKQAEETQRRVEVLAALRESEAASALGKVVSHDEVVRRFRSWRSK